MRLIPAAISILLSLQSLSAASIRLRQTNSGVESSDHDTAAQVLNNAAKKNRKYLRSLQGLDMFEMSMSMPSMTTGIESTSESGSDDTWVAEVINNLESKSGIAIPQSVAMDIVKSNELPAHHHSGLMKCRWFLTLLFKYKHYYFFGLPDDHLNHIIDNVCGDEDEDGPEPTESPTSCNEVVKEDYFSLPYVAQEERLLLKWDAPVVFDFTGLPAAAGNVQLKVASRGDLGDDYEFFTVTVLSATDRDLFLGTAGNDEGNDCSPIPKNAMFDISQADFNDGLDANNSTFTVTLTPNDCIDLICELNDVNVTLTYTSCA